MNAAAQLACTLLFAVSIRQVATAQGIGVEYCTSLPNSTGQAATLSVWGVPDTSGINMALLATNCPVNRPLIFIYGPDAGSFPLGSGTLCLSGSITRIMPLIMTDTAGSAIYWVTNADLSGPFGGTPLSPTLNYQAWFRDTTAAGSTSNLTSAVEVTFWPCVDCE
jgi:hypothetical protein